MLKDEFQILDHWPMALGFHFFTRVTELGHKTVLAHVGCLPLLQEPYLLHLFVRVIRVVSFARTAGTICHDHSTEPLIFAVKALCDAVVGSDLEIILMRDDSQMCHSP